MFCTRTRGSVWAGGVRTIPHLLYMRMCVQRARAVVWAYDFIPWWGATYDQAPMTDDVAECAHSHQISMGSLCADREMDERNAQQQGVRDAQRHT